jgi:hypothetical protein
MFLEARGLKNKKAINTLTEILAGDSHVGLFTDVITSLIRRTRYATLLSEFVRGMKRLAKET